MSDISARARQMGEQTTIRGFSRTASDLLIECADRLLELDAENVRLTTTVLDRVAALRNYRTVVDGEVAALTRASKRLRDLVEFGLTPCPWGTPHTVTGEEATNAVIKADAALKMGNVNKAFVVDDEMVARGEIGDDHGDRWKVEDGPTDE